MSYIFGDGFDLYSATADAGANYWDGSNGTTGWGITTGRFTGSQAAGILTTSGASMLVKSSGVNDAVHKFVVAVIQTLALSGTVNGICLQLLDGTTAQCTVTFRSDGAITLTSGASNGTVLATYTGAFSQNVWTAFEIEVTINNSTGSINIRKNGSGSNDFSATSLNTRGGTSNNYANKLQVITGSSSGTFFTANTQKIDDLLWRSDASSLAWVGDVRCYTRLPASDVSTQFSKSTGSTATTTPIVTSSTLNTSATRTHYSAFTAQFDGTIGSIICPLNTGYTGNMKCTLFASSGTAPTTVLGSATPIVNPVTGNNTFTFGTPVSVTRGTQYYVGFACDSASGIFAAGSASGNLGQFFDVAYSSFPTASPATTTSQAPVIFSYVTTLAGNFALVDESQQDSATSYVQDATVSDTDWYSIGALSSTPASTVAVTTRGFCQKTDAGSRVGAVQLKSSGSTVQASGALNTSWAWLWRTDTVDPATSAAWTAAAVNAAQIGPTVVS